MPYMPLGDAIKFHRHITECLSFMKNKEAASVDGVEDEHILPNLFHEEEEEPEWEIKTGSVTFEDLGVVPFVVTNYSVLWGKAEKYRALMCICDPIKDILTLFSNCESILHHPPAAILQELEDRVEQSKRQLLFSMCKKRLDPHDAICSLYPEMHTAVYQEDCVHCDPAIETVDEEDSPETMERLVVALEDFGFQHNEAYLPVGKAQKLLCAQGQLEFYTHQFEAMNNFFDAQHNFRHAIHPVLH